MAGAFTHICLVNEVFRRILDLPDDAFPEEVKTSLIIYKPFLVLGSVGPDYPLLDFGNKDSEEWSKFMHDFETGKFLQEGAFRARRLGVSKLRQKYIAWFLGYLSHYTADIVLHPIVEMLVGPYFQGNQTRHRECEMHQDVFIVRKLLNKELIEAELLDESILKCSENNDRSLLDVEVKMCWQDLLNSVYNRFAFVCKPEIDVWHSKYLFKIDRLAEEGSHIYGFAWFLNHFGLSYPWSSDLKEEFIFDLPSPSGLISFEAAFEKAVIHCLDNFISFSKYISAQCPRLTARFGNFSMDTGMDKNGKYLYW